MIETKRNVNISSKAQSSSVRFDINNQGLRENNPDFLVSE